MSQKMTFSDKVHFVTKNFFTKKQISSSEVPFAHVIQLLIPDKNYFLIKMTVSEQCQTP